MLAHILLLSLALVAAEELALGASSFGAPLYASYLEPTTGGDPRSDRDEAELVDFEPVTSATTDELKPGHTTIIENESDLAEFFRTIRPSLEEDPGLNSQAEVKRVMESGRIDFAQEVLVAAVSLPVNWCNHRDVGIRRVVRTKDSSLRLTVATRQYTESVCHLEDFADYPTLGQYGVAVIRVNRPVKWISGVNLVTLVPRVEGGFSEVEGESPNLEDTE